VSFFQNTKKGFPDSFGLTCSSYLAANRMVGNAVPPPLACSIGSEIEKAERKRRGELLARPDLGWRALAFALEDGEEIVLEQVLEKVQRVERKQQPVRRRAAAIAIESEEEEELEDDDGDEDDEDDDDDDDNDDDDDEEDRKATKKKKLGKKRSDGQKNGRKKKSSKKAKIDVVLSEGDDRFEPVVSSSNSPVWGDMHIEGNNLFFLVHSYKLILFFAFCRASFGQLRL
jgi:hypothetical protein